jgi:branched-subunit amino acid aminotransferase/4-amino-4-deoxychorismate lyase
MLIYLNGAMVPKEEAKVSVFDHGFLYGDGVFEGIRVYEGRIFRLEEHVARLYESARTLELHVPMEQPEMIDATRARSPSTTRTTPTSGWWCRAVPATSASTPRNVRARRW